MKILESPLLGEFIAYLKANWTGRSRVDQRRRRLRQLILKVRAVTEVAEGHAVRAGSLAAWLTMLRDEALRGQKVLDAARCDAAAVAGSTRRFLCGLRALVACNPEVDRLTEAVEELEHLAGPGGDLDQFMRLLRLDNDVRARGPAAMEVDGGGRVGAAQPQQQRQQEESCGSGGGSVVPAGAKRKRACGSGVVEEGGGSTSDGQVLHSVGARRKRRVLGWAWPRNWLPTFGGFFSAPRQQPPPPAAASRSHRARTVAVAMGRVRRRIGKPTGRRRPRLRQESIDQQLWRLSL